MNRVVILDNLRSAFNVGSIFRTASALDYNEIALCGVSVTPPSKKLRETSRGTDEQIAWSYFTQTTLAIEHYQKKGYHLWALESGSTSQTIKKLPFLEKVAWLLGNEALGLSDQHLKMMEGVYALPMREGLSSINVSSAFSAAAYFDHLKS